MNETTEAVPATQERGQFRGDASSVTLEPDPSGLTIMAVGVGGCGCNVVDSLARSGLEDVGLAAVNTDAQTLASCKAPIKVEIGDRLTGGHGTGSNPELGRQAALESTDELSDLLNGADILFVIAGMGGGTGTGAAPVITSLAKQLNVLTISFAVMPFSFEGARRARQAAEGLERLADQADTAVAVDNDQLIDWVDAGADVNSGFKLVHRVIERVVSGISAILSNQGIMNVDFAHMRQVFHNGGVGIAGYGQASGPDAAVQAVREAVEHPLMAGESLSAASNVLVNIHSSEGFSMMDCTAALKLVESEVHGDANLILGMVPEGPAGDVVRVLVVASGINSTDFGMRVGADVDEPGEVAGEMGWRQERAIELSESAEPAAVRLGPPAVESPAASEGTRRMEGPPNPPDLLEDSGRHYMPTPDEDAEDETVNAESQRGSSFFGRRKMFR